MAAPFSVVLRAWLIGNDPRQQLRVSQAWLVLVMNLAFAGLQHIEVMLGMIPFEQSWPLSMWSVGGGLLFYGLLRSGWNLRLSRDRALAVPQSVWALTSLAWSYAITGPARGAILLIMVSVVMFGMFSLSARQQARLAGLAFALLAGSMAWKGWTDPLRYDPRIEVIHLLFAGVVLASAAALSARIGALRTKLQEQKRELEAAVQRIQALATRDELTGLTNRRSVLERMHSELAVRGRPEPLMSLALIDIDHFKRVNDGFGHAAGDAVLRRFAERGQAIVRAGDVLARWGGEEFLLVMPATAAPQAMAALARLRLLMQQERLDDIAPGLEVSFSAGVAECVGSADLEAAIERADAAMYVAKRSGRDRAVLAAAPSGTAATQSQPAPVATV